MAKWRPERRSVVLTFRLQRLITGVLSDTRPSNRREEFLKSFPSIGLSPGLRSALKGGRSRGQSAGEEPRVESESRRGRSSCGGCSTMEDALGDPERAGLEDEHDFVDVLEERRRGADLGFALRTFSPQPYRDASPCSTSDLSRAVMESQFLRYVVQEITTETGVTAKEVREDALAILEEMSQNLQLGFIRLMAYTLSKVFKRLFSSIFVNAGGLHTLQQAIQENPVILMPNHRSYIDFLAISYILFSHDIPVPVIAAGIPLAGMKMVGEILRRSGAFFIRRSIGSDKLYWAVLSEYIKTIVRKGFAPVEFYVEGLRSRTLKSLVPRLGMMHMVLEPFFKGEVFDITLVPVSISYDRVLEESLLAQELLGIPKPKESTTGLLKASKVLQEAYGSMHVTFGRPLSVRQLCQGKINRCQYNLRPRDLPQKPSVDTQACVSWLAHLMVRFQEGGAVISPWSLMACLLLQTPVTLLLGEGLSWRRLTEKTLWLRKLALEFGGRLNWPDGAPHSDVMSSAVDIHRSLVRREAGRVRLVQEGEPARKRAVSLEDGVVGTASAVLMLASYRNQCVHVFLRPAILAAAIHASGATLREELFNYFRFLLDVFSNEFVFVPGKSRQDFQEACFLLKKCGAVHVTQQEVKVSDAGGEVLDFLQTLLQPFINSYRVVFRYLCEDDHQVLSERQLLPSVRKLATELILSGELDTYETLSSDLQKNVLSALRRLGVATKTRVAEQDEYRVEREAVRRIQDTLAGKIPPRTLQTTPDAKL